MIQLTDVQKEELKAAKVEFAKATLDVKNELNELRAYQRTLMSVENLNETKVFENIDKMTALQKQLMKERIDMRLTTCKFLSGEQGMFNQVCDYRSGRRGQGVNNRRGMKQGRGQMQKAGRSGFYNQRSDWGIGTMNSYRNYCSGIDVWGLSEDQLEKMKTMRVAHLKASQNLREEMQELRLKQRHLVNDDQLNKNEIMSNIDRISTIQKQLAKQRVKNQMEVRNILDEDQLILFLAKPHKMHNNNNNRGGKMHRRF
jgi:Spy/CpxP family protein refolding chaperone